MISVALCLGHRRFRLSWRRRWTQLCSSSDRPKWGKADDVPLRTMAGPPFRPWASPRRARGSERLGGDFQRPGHLIAHAPGQPAGRATSLERTRSTPRRLGRVRRMPSPNPGRMSGRPQFEPRSTEPKVRGSNPLGRATCPGRSCVFAGVSSRRTRSAVRRSEARERFRAIFWRTFWRTPRTELLAARALARTSAPTRRLRSSRPDIHGRSVARDFEPGHMGVVRSHVRPWQGHARVHVLWHHGRSDSRACLPSVVRPAVPGPRAARSRAPGGQRDERHTSQPSGDQPRLRD